MKTRSPSASDALEGWGNKSTTVKWCIRSLMTTKSLCQLELRDWLSYHGQQNTLCETLKYKKKNTLPKYHVKCHGRFLCSLLRIHGYLTREIYHGNVRLHTLTQFPPVKGPFTTQ